ncbi:U32 family peptidase [Photobacterium gaetbulicola]|uniref:Collagenase-like protein n=1 Tax=Photobacterium gaetbulicola Gung47 TaxID=658445 RepID=A0A0C5WRG5_9GAMM|nr:peptidase U32 family protein [Photobacterium gaetbulicola]AJR05560.1 collagenase-like protein [Photobacterium gaetbulicola Gung47]PSU14544.1 U32 family peptidase [Photobacterium gaetbulicola]
MSDQFELLAPGGDLESIKAAIVAGADAVYCGLDNFNARNRATNLTFENLSGVVRLAHQHQCKIFLTLNVIILESEVPALVRLLNKLVNTDIDGVIVQDIGLFSILKTHFPSLDVHASTQLNTHNEGQILFLKQLTASRVNLSRELNIDEIKQLAQFGHQHDVLMEVFVHGSYCIGFSGLCYISSVRNGSSGNRGRCSQPCREQYQTTETGKDYPLNLKDNSAFSDMAALADAGVYSLKVEGRIKKSHYVYTVVDTWRQQIDSYCSKGEILTDTSRLYTVFNRDFSNAFLKGDINKSMFIDNPRDHAATHFSNIYSCTSMDEVKAVKKKLYDTKTDIIQQVERVTKELCVEKLALDIKVIAAEGLPLKVELITPQGLIELQSESNLVSSEKFTLDKEGVSKWVNSFANADYRVNQIDLSALASGLYIPYKEQTVIKEKVAVALNGNKPLIAPVELSKPGMEAASEYAQPPQLHTLISSVEDLVLQSEPNTFVYYQLPEALACDLDRLVDLFEHNDQLVPWFPAILIGENYDAAVAFLEQVQPSRIVTNNSGVGYAAYQRGIDWVAGPQMNIINSYSLACLKEEFNCVGAFISNEINKKQIKPLVKPDNFELFYSIYHPITLLTSRQCLFHQTVGCKKKRFDDKCLRKCDKSASILSLKHASYVVDKQRGAHNSLYSQENYLNLDVIKDHPGLFDGYMVDMRDIKTHTQMALEKPALLEAFCEQLTGDAAPSALHTKIAPTTMAQYKKGL